MNVLLLLLRALGNPHRAARLCQNRNKLNLLPLATTILRLRCATSSSTEHTPPSPSPFFSFCRLSRAKNPTSSMLPGFLSFLVLSPLSALAQQTVYNQAHNTTAIGGTWSSGAMNVLTGTVRFFFLVLLLSAVVRS
jgi:hypothetical protein